MIFQVVRGVKEQKIIQNDKKVISVTLYILGTIHHMILFMVRMYKVVISPGIFLHFFEIFVFGVISGVKEQKMAQNDKKLCLSRSVFRNRKSYDCHFWYTWVMMISPAIVFIFSKFWFFGFFFGKTVKNDPKLPISVCHALYLRNCRSYHWDFLHIGVK